MQPPTVLANITNNLVSIVETDPKKDSLQMCKCLLHECPDATDLCLNEGDSTKGIHVRSSPAI